MLLKKSIARFAVITVAAGLLVFLGSGRFFQPWRGMILDSAAGIMSPVRGGLEWLKSRFISQSGQRIRALEEERKGLLAEIAELEAQRRENEILREALVLRQAGEEGAISAKAVGFFREGRDEFLLLNRGTDDGIGIGDIVLDPKRVFGGTVVEVSRGSSRVILISSPSRSIDVLIPSANLRAISRGNNSRELIIDLVPQDSGVKAGDMVMASSRAVGGRPPILIGQIREVRQAENDVFKTVRAVHIFNPAEEEVLVLLAP